MIGQCTAAQPKAALRRYKILLSRPAIWTADLLTAARSVIEPAVLSPPARSIHGWRPNLDLE